MTLSLRRRIQRVGAAMAEAGRVRLPPGPVAEWSADDAARASVLLGVCGAALWVRLDDEVLAALNTQLRGDQGEN